MATAVIVDAVRTPGGRRNGKLRDWHPVDHKYVASQHEGKEAFGTVEMPYGTQVLWPYPCPFARLLLCPLSFPLISFWG